MADTLTTGTSLSTVPSGSVIGTDEVTIGATLQHVQRVKLVDGTDGGTGLIGGDATNGLDVDVTRVSGNVAVTIAAGATAIAKAEDVASADGDVGVPALMVRKATPANTSGTDGDYEFIQGSAGRLWTSTVVDTALPAGTNAIGKLAANTGVTIGAVELAAAQTLATVTTVSTVTSVTAIGTSVTPGTSAAHLGKAEDAAAASGDTGVAVWAVRRDTPTISSGTAGDYSGINVNANGALWVSLTPNTTGGVTVFHVVGSATTNATNVKASAGSIYGWNMTNSGTAWAYVKFHNTAGTPTAGASVAYVVGIPPGGGTNESIPEGIPFGTGIGITTVTGIADSNTTAIAASEININIRYK